MFFCSSCVHFQILAGGSNNNSDVNVGLPEDLVVWKRVCLHGWEMCSRQEIETITGSVF